jgi:amino acid transporter
MKLRICDAVDEAAVDLDHVRRGQDDVPKRREAGADVVDRQPHPALAQRPQPGQNLWRKPIAGMFELLAELSAMMPERTGGSPSYAYPAYRERWPRYAGHINGVTAWAYWLGWFPVAPLNMILASFYIVDKFGLSTNGITPIHTPIAYWTIIISIIGILLVFIPAWLGIRLGAMFATVLGLLSMIPLTLIAILPLFKPSSRDFGNLSGFKQLDGTSFFSPLLGHGWLTIYIAFAFLLTWNVRTFRRISG